MRKSSIAGLAAALAGAGVALWLLPAPPRTRPSFLVIVVDSMRADHVGAYGYARPTTPRLDALARDGIVFENAFSQAPWTKPSVASLFTSTYISVHRVLYSEQTIDGAPMSDVLNEKFLTLAEAMSADGFATAGFGQKIHLRPEFGFSQGFDGYDMHARRAEKVNRAALQWLDRLEPERFFMYLHYNDPHYPYTPRPRYSRFGAATPRVQINGETKRAFREGKLALGPSDMQQLVDLYDGEILYTDHHIGELLDAIEAMGYRNLLVLVTADHGEEFLDHGDITHGQSLYGELVRVPFIAGGSGLPAAGRGRREAAGVQIIDIMPTLLDLAGLPQPPGLQGRSFAEMLAGAGGAGPHIFSERRDLTETEFCSAISDGRWKLVEDPVNRRTMLFDLRSDPGETLRLEARNQDVVAALRERLSTWAAANSSLHDRLRPQETTPLDPETEERLRSLGYIN